MSAHPHQSLGHETSDAKIPPIVATGFLLAVGAALVIFLVYGIFQFLARHPAVTAPANPMATAEQPFPPTPRIEEHPYTEVQQLRQQEDTILSTYGWADKNAGLVRIPIDRAMDLALERKFALSKDAAKKEAAKK